MSVQYVNTLNYYARKIKLQTMLLNVCSVIMVTPAGRAEEPLQKKRRKGLNKILVVAPCPLACLTASVVFPL